MDCTQRIAKVVQDACRDDTPLHIAGSGSKSFYTGPIAGELLDVRPHCGIVSYEPSELVLTARAGTPLAEIEDLLAQHGQMLAFEPPHYGPEATLGGTVACGFSGPRRAYSGSLRDFVLGVRIVNGKGEVLRFGGQVMKNVAGFDVSRLLCGSLGILGVITEISLKVLPLPRAEETLRFEMSASEAITSFNRWSGQPLPLSGASWYQGVAWVRLSGASSAVQAARQRLGGERVDPTAASQWWNTLRHCTHPIFNSSSLWRLSVPQTTPPLDLHGEPLIDWGGALRWYPGNANATLPNTGGTPDSPIATSPEAIATSPEPIATSPATSSGGTPRPRQVASAVGGTAICWKGIAPVGGRFHPLQPTVAALHRRLKDRFDPHGIFNPGRMIAGL